MATSEIKDIVQNMISGYELAPSQTYFNYYSGEDNSHPYPYKTETGSLNYAQIKALLASFGHNTSLFNPSESFHSPDNNLSNTNGVDVTLVVGSGKNTLGQIIEEKNYKDMIYINGDGTVPLLSASLIDYSKSLVLLGNAKVFYTNQGHGELVGLGPALNLVKNILEGNDQLPDEVSTHPYSLSNGWLFSKHSPVDMSIYDSENNHTGPTADGFETNIPGSSYETLDDAAFIFIPGNGTYKIKLEATDNGSFDFKIRKFENETLSKEILYDDVPLTISTKSELAFDTSSSQNPIMYLDEDGNGTTDKEVNSYTGSSPASTPTPTQAPTSIMQPIPTPTVFPAASASQTESEISKEGNVLGVKTNSQKEQGVNSKVLGVTEKSKNLPLIVSLIVFVGGLAVVYIRLKR